MRRIVRDFSSMLPGLRLKVVSPGAFLARVRGRPILPGEDIAGEGPQPYPLYTLASTLVVMVDIEGLRSLLEGEDRRLQRVLAEGMILYEVIYLAASRQPLPDPGGRAESILRRHWPFQYTAVRSAGLMAGRDGSPWQGRDAAGDN